MKGKRIVSTLLCMMLILTCFGVGTIGASSAGIKYEIVISVDPNDTTVDLSSFETDLKTQMKAEFLTKYGQVLTDDDIEISYITSNDVKTNEQSVWNIYDNYYSPDYDASSKTTQDKEALLALAGRTGQPFYYFRESSVSGSTFYTTVDEGIDAIHFRDKHIYAEGDRITFLGYGTSNFKDFMIYPDESTGEKTIEYSIYLDNLNTHTLNGAGFLINSKITGTGSSAVINGYLIYYAYSGAGASLTDTLNIYKLTDVNVDALHAPGLIAAVPGVTAIQTSIPVQVTGKAVKDIKIVVNEDGFIFYEKNGTNPADTYHEAINKTGLVITGGYGFGPFVGYNSHGCSMITIYTYDNLDMVSDVTKTFENKLLETKWTDGAVHAMINVNDSGIVDFNNSNARAEMLYRLLNSDVSYIGWGIGDKSQELSFMHDNNDKGMYIDTSIISDNVTFGSDLSTVTAADHTSQVSEIAKYLVGMVEPLINQTPVARINYNGTALSSGSTDPNGDALTEYWSIKEAGDADWIIASDAADATAKFDTFKSSPDLNILIQLIVEDTGGNKSEPAVRYFSTETGIKPIAEFTIDGQIDLESDEGTILATDNLSFDPLIPARDDLTYSWQVYNEMNGLKLQSTEFEPAFDFAGFPSGRYEVRLTVSADSDTVHSNVFVQAVELIDLVPPSLYVSLTGNKDAAVANIQIVDNGSGPNSYRVITKNLSDVIISGPWVPSLATYSISKTYNFVPSSLKELSFEVKDSSGNTASYPVQFDVPIISYSPSGGVFYNNFIYGDSDDVLVEISSFSTASITEWYYEWLDTQVYPVEKDIKTDGTLIDEGTTLLIPQPNDLGTYYLHVLAINSAAAQTADVSDAFSVSMASNGVHDLKVSDINGDDIYLSWTMPRNATAQKILYSDDNGATWSDATTPALTGNSNTTIVTGLDTDNNYLFRVLVNGGEDAGISNTAKWINLITYAAGDSNASVTKNVTLVTENVSWSSSNSVIVDKLGNVFRPAYSEGDSNVTLRAVIEDGEYDITIDFQMTVIALPATDEEAVTDDKANLAISYALGDDATSVTQNVVLPAVTDPSQGSSVTWASSDAGTIAINGTVTRPSFSAGNKIVTLTATITKNAETETKVFDLNVIKLPQTDTEALANVLIGYAPLDSASSVTQNVTLPTIATNGQAVSWASNTPGTIAVDGTVVRPANGSGNAAVVLTATINAVNRTFDLTVIEEAANDVEAVADDKAILDIIYAPGDNASSVTLDVTLVTSLINGSSVAWGSDVSLTIDTDGKVTRPAGDDVIVTLTATITKGVETDTKVFVLTVKKTIENTDVADVASDKALLEITYAPGDSAASVTQNVGLPETAANGSTVTWVSDITSTVDVLGNVYRPAWNESDVTVTLIATITKGAASDTKEFVVIVKKLGSTDISSIVYDKESLQIGYQDGDNAASVTKDVTLPVVCEKGSTVVWASNNEDVVSNDGIVSVPEVGEGDATVILTATLSNNGLTETRIFEVIVKAKTQVIIPEDPPMIVYVNGIPQAAGTKHFTVIDGRSCITVLVDESVINKKIDDLIAGNALEDDNTVKVPVMTYSFDMLSVKLSGDMVKKMEDNGFDLLVQFNGIEYQIPAKEIKIAMISNEFNAGNDEIDIEIKIENMNSQITSIIQKSAVSQGYELKLPPVEFTVTATIPGTAGKMVIDRFGQFVKRIVMLPIGIDSNQITTGILYNTDGTFSHIPTFVFQVGYRWYAELNSFTNSCYSIIWNPIEVASVQGKWSEKAVDDMSSRLIVKNPENFLPDAVITRGEFAEYLIKAIGLFRTGIAVDGIFEDLDKEDELADALKTAYEYGIVKGYDNGMVGADDNITREQAMTMFARTMEVIGFEKTVDINAMDRFTDLDEISIWAYDAVEKVVKAGIFYGTSSNTLTPQGIFTYAEAAQAVCNLLMQAGLINE